MEFAGELVEFTNEARMVTKFVLIVSTLTPRVGDEVVVTADAGDGCTYKFTVYKSNVLHTADPGFSPDDSRAYAFSQPGSYKVEVSATDGVNPIQTRWTGVITVSLRGAPVITGVTAVSGTALNVAWTAVPGADGYEVWRTDSQGGTFKLVNFTAQTSYTNTYRTPGMRYFYKVRAYNVVHGKKAPSSPFSAPRTGVPVARPVIQSIQSVSPGAVKITWNKAPGAASYGVFVAARAGGAYVKMLWTMQNYAVVENLQPGTVYFFQVQGCKRLFANNHYGPLSGWRSFRTPK